MFIFHHFTALLAAYSLFGAALAHPGEEKIKREIAEHKAAQIKGRQSLAQCANTPSSLALKERAVAHRAAKAQDLRQKRALTDKSMKNKRDVDALARWMAVSHDESALGYTSDTPLDTIFSGNATCSLASEVTIGPYYVAGVLTREDVTEGTAGVPLYLNLQFVEISTCDPITGYLIDIWQCNAIGAYHPPPPHR
ncbi:Intradiol ring-cleavage dioxygenase [Pseudomassariella vexata]|uniref:Intradiol ring-cleavage dioxygenase n=1 Tax=Pseudomassariella vexata TaxID=1141098 RepID=A0A1Y2DL26_9PEZI|nr:Intradiol ring-cleavage dioxygenase [Pseudomassariella vexata]ORY59947.1 Intradiol ring-cleavage dioxygenase [Pseudomassariella vexata]